MHICIQFYCKHYQAILPGYFFLILSQQTLQRAQQTEIKQVIFEGRDLPDSNFCFGKSHLPSVIPQGQHFFTLQILI